MRWLSPPWEHADGEESDDDDGLTVISDDEDDPPLPPTAEGDTTAAKPTDGATGKEQDEDKSDKTANANESESDKSAKATTAASDKSAKATTAASDKSADANNASKDKPKVSVVAGMTELLSDNTGKVVLAAEIMDFIRFVGVMIALFYYGGGNRARTLFILFILATGIGIHLYASLRQFQYYSPDLTWMNEPKQAELAVMISFWFAAAGAQLFYLSMRKQTLLLPLGILTIVVGVLRTYAAVKTWHKPAETINE